MAAGALLLFAGMRGNERKTLDTRSQIQGSLARGEFGGHARRADQPGKLWFFTSYEYITKCEHRVQSNSLRNSALCKQLATGGFSNVRLDRPGSVFRLAAYEETIFLVALDWRQSERSPVSFAEVPWIAPPPPPPLIRRMICCSRERTIAGANDKLDYYNVLPSNSFSFQASHFGRAYAGG